MDTRTKDTGETAAPHLTPEMEKIVAAAVAAALASQKAAEAKPEQKAEKEAAKGDAISEPEKAAPEPSVSQSPSPSGVPGKWGIKTAFKSCLQRYTKFDGRASRPEFWYLALGNFIVVMSVSLLNVVATVLCLYTETAILLPQLACSILVMVYGLFMLLPGLSLCVRRLHDTGRDWRLLLLGLIPGVGALILLYFFIQPSAPANKYGSEADGLAGEDEKMPPFVAAIAGKAATLLRRPGRTAAILSGGIAAVVGLIVLINFVFARPNPLEALYEQGKLAKSPRDASNMYEGLFCKQVEAYLNGDAELNALPYIANLLTVADSKGFMVPVEVVSALVELGADVNAKSKIGAFGETPWNLAVKMGDIAMLDYLASAGAKKTEFLEMEQPHVVQAALEEKEDLLRALVRHGMSLEVQKSATDYTALMAAADKGNTKMLNLLIELGGNVNATRAELGGEKVTVLDMVLQDGRDNDAEMAGILIKAGAKATPNKLADKLFRCIDDGQTERLKMLLDAGAPLDAVQEFTAYTPLMAAVGKNNLEIVKLLLDAGADPKVTTKDDAGIAQSALSIAKRKASSAVLALLGDEQAIKMQKALGDTKLISLDEAVEMLQKCEIIDEYATTENIFSGKVDDSKGKISKEFLYNYKMFKEGNVALSDYAYVSSIYFCWSLEPSKHFPKEAIIAFIASGSALSSKSGPFGSVYMWSEFNALECAAGEGHTEIVQMLIAAGADVSKEAPLAAAARGGHTEIVKLLLERPEIDTDIRIDSETARKYPEIAELLKAAKRKKLEQNEEVSSQENTDSSVSEAEDTQESAEPDSDSLTTLIDKLKQTEYNDATLKLYQKRLMDILPRIAAGESVNTKLENANGTTALHNACGLGHYDIVKWLVEHGADCSLRTAKGASVEACIGHDQEGKIRELIRTAKNGVPQKTSSSPQKGTGISDEVKVKLKKHAEQLDSLLPGDVWLGSCKSELQRTLNDIIAGKDVNYMPSDERGAGVSALHNACALGITELVDILLSVPGINVNIRRDKETPLCYAVSAGHDDIVQKLISSGADVNAGNPLWTACNAENIGIVKLLLSVEGIDINKGAALAIAAGRGNLPIVKLLLEFPGIDVNKVDDSQLTALQRAAIKGNKEIVQLLLKVPGIKVNKVNRKGLSALQMAQNKGHDEVVQLLKAAGAK